MSDFFLNECARSLSVERKFLTSDAINCLSSFPFSGNVRQLKNICHWLTVMGPNNTIGPIDLPDEVKSYQPEFYINETTSINSDGFNSILSSSNSEKTIDTDIQKSMDWQVLLRKSLKENLSSNPKLGNCNTSYDYWAKQFETIIYKTALEFTRGRRLEASKLLNVGRNTVTRKIKELDLNF